MTKDEYLSLAAPAEGLYKEKGSKFIAYAFSVRNEDEIKQQLIEVKKLHPKARHHCFAFRLGMDKNNYRANDDGEPSGTAGKPILGQIDSMNLTNVLVVVVRYFGGTKLGVPGLIHAYKESTRDALEQAEIITKVVEERYEYHFGYDKMSDVMNALKRWNINILQQDFQATAVVKIAIPKSEVEPTLLKIKAAIMKVSVSEAEMKVLQGVEVVEVG